MNNVTGEKFEPVAGFDGLSSPHEGQRILHATPLKDYTPQKDLVLSFRAETPDTEQIRAITAGSYQMLSFRTPRVHTKRSEAPKDWNFYFDTSASNADTAKQRLTAIRSLLEGIDGHFDGATSLSVSAFDVDVVSLEEHLQRNVKDGAPHFTKDISELTSKLEARHFLGATNLEAALKHIGDDARAEQKPTCFVLVSDGIATLGARETRDLLAALGNWPEKHVLHALVIGSKQDEKTLNAIVEKTNGRVVTLPLTDHVQADIPRVISELTEPVGATYEFYDESAAWIYPKIFRDVRGETELVVFSQLKDGAKSKPGVVARAAGAKPVDKTLTAEPTQVPDFAPLLQREAIAAYLDHLEQLEQTQTDAAKRAELRKQRVELSEKNRVLCPLTSMLVLESENDYARFGIERTSLADIMVVSDNGIALQHRTTADLPPAPAAVNHFMRKGVEELQKKEEDGIHAGPSGAARGGADADKLKDSVNLEVDDKPADGRALSGEPFLDVAAKAASVSGGGGGFVDDLAQRPSNARSEMQFRRNAPVPDRAREAAASPAPEAAAVTTTPPAPQDRQRSLSVARATQIPSPAWTRQFAAPPTAAELNTLHAQVAANPRDRGLRNAYASALCAAQKWDELQGQAFEWLPFDPENPQVFEYLGKSATGLGDKELALRAMTSIAEVAPNRAALLARAGWLLLTAEKFDMAEQMFREALKNRKDDPNIYRGLALALWMAEKYDVAAKELDAAIQVGFNGRYGDVRRVLHEELGYVLRAWAQKAQNAATTFAQFHGAEQDMRRSDALRVTMGWETDANDVDLHVVDPNGEECWYSHMGTASGLELYSDQTQGLGPEVIRTEKALPGTYSIGVTYFNAGPMGVSRGVVVIMKPQDGIVKHPQVVPFCLTPGAVGGADIRMVGEVKF